MFVIRLSSKRKFTTTYTEPHYWATELLLRCNLPLNLTCSEAANSKFPLFVLSFTVFHPVVTANAKCHRFRSWRRKADWKFYCRRMDESTNGASGWLLRLLLQLSGKLWGKKIENWTALRQQMHKCETSNVTLLSSEPAMRRDFGTLSQCKFQNFKIVKIR